MSNQSGCLILSICVALSCACASNPATPVAAKQTANLLPELPFGSIPVNDEPFTFTEAEEIIGRVEAAWAPAAGDPLLAPSSLKEAEKILKLDQTNLFAAAIEFTKEEGSLEAEVLHAQIELAWGESYTVLMEVLMHVGRHLDRATMRMQQRDPRTPKLEAAQARLQELTDRISRVIEIFQAMSLEQISEGSRMTSYILENNPESYLGYRLAADHFRMVRKWKQFDQMVAQLEKRNPDSNGLIFLRAAAALQRDEDAEAAINLYRKALANDPEFVRAQAHLVMSQPDLDGIRRELHGLNRLNPNHQLVRWLAPTVDIAYKASRLANKESNE